MREKVGELRSNMVVKGRVEMEPVGMDWDTFKQGVKMVAGEVDREKIEEFNRKITMLTKVFYSVIWV